MLARGKTARRIARWTALFGLLACFAATTRGAEVEINSSEVGRAIDRLEAALPNKPGDKDWRAYFNFDLIGENLLIGTLADEDLIQQTIERCKADLGGIDEAAVAAYRNALEHWLLDLSGGSLQELQRRIAAVEQTFEPPDAAKLEAFRRDVVAAMAQLNKVFTGKNGEEWKKYLQWSDLEAQTAAGVKPDVNVLGAVRHKFTEPHAGLELPVFANLADSLRRYGNYAGFTQLPEPAETYQSVLEELGKQLAVHFESFDAGQPDPEAARFVGRLLGWINDVQQASELVQAARQRLCHPNLIIQASGRFVSQGIDNTDIGNGERILARLVPHADRGLIEIALRGTDSTANKYVTVDEYFARGLPAWGLAASRGGSPIAAAAAAAGRLDAHGLGLRDQINRETRGLYVELRSQRLLPESIEVYTSGDRLTGLAQYADSFQLGAPELPPEFEGTPKLAVCIHQSMYNNYGDRLAGVTLTEEKARQMLESVHATLPESLEHEPDRDPWSVTFSMGEPLRLTAWNNTLRVTWAFSRFTSGERQFRAMNVTTEYKLEWARDRLQLIRQGELQIAPPGPARLLTGREITLRTLLEKRFSKILDRIIGFDALLFPGPWQRAGKLHVTQFICQGGWLGLAFEEFPAVHQGADAPDRAVAKNPAPAPDDTAPAEPPDNPISGAELRRQLAQAKQALSRPGGEPNKQTSRSRIQIVSDTAEVKAGTNTIATATKGREFNVIKTNGPWYGVSIAVGSGQKTGWVHQSNAGLLVDASPKFNPLREYRNHLQQVVWLEDQLRALALANPPDESALRWVINQDLKMHTAGNLIAHATHLLQAVEGRSGPYSPEANSLRAKIVAVEMARPEKRGSRTRAQQLASEVIRLRRAGNYLESIAAARELVALREELIPGESFVQNPFLQLTLRASDVSAEVHSRLRISTDIWKHILGEANPYYLESLDNLASLYRELGSFEQEAEVRRFALGLHEKHPQSSPWPVARARSELETADLLKRLSPDDRRRFRETQESKARLDRIHESEGEQPLALAKTRAETLQQLLGQAHALCGEAVGDWCELLLAQGDDEAALKTQRRWLEAAKSTERIGCPAYCLGQRRAAAIDARLGNYDSARSAIAEAIAVGQQLYGTDDWRVTGWIQQAREIDLLASLDDAQRTALEEANSIAGRVASLRRQQKYPQAIDEAQRELARRAEVSKDSLAYLRALATIAKLHELAGDYGSAVPLRKQAVERAEQLFAKGHPEHAAALCDLAEDLLALGEYEAAERHGVDALNRLAAKLDENHLDMARAMSLVSNIYMEIGQYARAADLLSHAVEVYRHVHVKTDREFLAMLNSQTMLLRRMGNYVEAERSCLQVVQMAKQDFGDQDPLYAMCLQNLAGYYRDIGNYERSVARYDDAAQIRGQHYGTDSLEFADDMTNLAAVYEESGNYERGEQCARQAIGIYRDRVGTGHARFGLALEHLAASLAGQKKFGEADELLQQAGEIRSANGDHRPSAFMARGNLCLAQGDFADAAGLFEQAIAAYSKFDTKHPDLVECLHGLGVANAHSRGWPAARGPIDRSRRVSRQHVGQVLPALSEREQMRFLQAKDRKLFHQSVSLALASRGAEKKQRDDTLPALSAGWVLNRKALLQQTLAESVLLARDSNDPMLDEVARKLQTTRAQIAKFTVQEGDSTDPERRRELDALVEEEQALTKRRSQLLDQNPDSASYVELADIQRSLPARCVLIEFLRFDKTDMPFSIESPTKGHYAAWVVNRSEVDFVDLGPAEPIDKAIEAARRQIRMPDLFDPASLGAEDKRLHALLKRLADRVLTPLESHISPLFNRWLISPDGPLWTVPWAALPVDDEHYLVEKIKISLLSSGRELIWGRRAAAYLKSRSGLVLANPDFDEAETAPSAQRAFRGILPDEVWNQIRSHRFTSLPGSAAEARQIVPYLKAYLGTEPRVFLKERATESAFKSFFRPTAVVISTHGFLRVGRHDRSPGMSLVNPLADCGVVLAGANRGRPGPNGEDGILTGLEIVSSDLRGTDLVVLSACQTGLGEIQEGEGVADLRQAFRLAGARGVVSTLWHIRDWETSQLMVDFWKYLAETQDPADALCNAQKAFINRARQKEQNRRKGTDPAAKRGLKLDDGSLADAEEARSLSHPLYWAAFTVTGQVEF